MSSRVVNASNDEENKEKKEKCKTKNNQVLQRKLTIKIFLIFGIRLYKTIYKIKTFSLTLQARF